MILPWFSVTLVLAGTGAAIADPPVQPTEIATINLSPSTARAISACRADAERQGLSEKGLRAVRWSEAAPAAPTQSRDGIRMVTHVSLAGDALSPTGAVTFKAQCDYVKGRPATVSFDLNQASLPVLGLNLSGVTPVPESPKTGRLLVQNPPLAAPLKNQSDTGATSQFSPVLKEVTTDTPINVGKRADFIHDHLFGIQMQTPF